MNERQIRPIKPEVSPELREYFVGLRTEDNAGEILRRRGVSAIDRYWATQFVDLVEEDIRPLPEDENAPRKRHYFPGGSVAVGPNYVKRRDTDKGTGKQERNDE